jgi:type VI secretion system protein ImpK
MFGVHIAGQVFFGNVDRLLARQNSVHLADVLELYELCLLLGYRGRYSAGGGADVRSLSASIRAKIRQIRGAPAVLPWAPPAGESPSAPPDLWGRRLVWGAVASCLLALILFAGFQFSLHGQLSEVHAAVRQGSGGRP